MDLKQQYDLIYSQHSVCLGDVCNVHSASSLTSLTNITMIIFFYYSTLPKLNVATALYELLYSAKVCDSSLLPTL